MQELRKRKKGRGIISLSLKGVRKVFILTLSIFYTLLESTSLYISRGGMMMREWLQTASSLDVLYPCSSKTREVLGNPFPTPKGFPETREISQMQSPRKIWRVERNLEIGGGLEFPISGGVLVENKHSLFIMRKVLILVLSIFNALKGCISWYSQG